ncbi:MAG: glycosyltransferase [Thermoleophilia bacterium]|nr:glycosyltransferase [Thermoleophilia bacterium]
MSIVKPKTVAASTEEALRPRVHGKFIYHGDRKLFLRGVTYGTFRPHPDGHQFPDRELVERDFAMMAQHGLNTLRTYTVPPRWLLDIAERNGLWVMVGMPWEQHVTFLDDRKLARGIERRVREGVSRCKGHPAVLCYTIGNEIPSPIVRWHNRRQVEKFIESLCDTVRDVDAGALTTYVNYPTTEYLQLPFVDFFCFNVYLESQWELERYMARLHNLADERPLVMAEIGLDSLRHGESRQAEVLDWQIRTAAAAGCAGLFVFKWTDEWYRGGADIDDWMFGLTTVEREPKPALAAVSRAFARTPFDDGMRWPKVSVVCCSYNGSRTIRKTLEELQKLDYPDYEVIVVNDGSTDNTGEIAREFPVRLITTVNRGLSNARNTGYQEAKGEIVAYIDDDAYPDPHWLRFLAYSFITGDWAGVGGPNLMPEGCNSVAEAVANAPGGPTHVLITDTEAEHIPGCNMAFQKRCLEAIGGFDAQCRAAGDDVDCCWRLQGKGWKLGFNAAAVVWHLRRDTIRDYWKQQAGYGKAESILERKWPERYNGVGHVSWGGRIYGKGLIEPIHLKPRRIYQGVWGSAPFQSLYEPKVGAWSSLPLMPEWYLVALVLAVISLLQLLWLPLISATPLLLVAVGAPVFQAIRAASQAKFTSEPETAFGRFKLRALTAFLHLLQPAARLYGRIKHGLTPWRLTTYSGWLAPWPRKLAVWRTEWQEPAGWLRELESAIRKVNAPLLRGGQFDHWDMEVRGGLFGRARVLMAIEDHGGNKQYARFRLRPRIKLRTTLFIGLLLLLGLRASVDQAWTVTGIFWGLAFFVMFRAVREVGGAMAVIRDAVGTLEESDRP